MTTIQARPIPTASTHKVGAPAHAAVAKEVGIAGSLVAKTTTITG